MRMLKFATAIGVPGLALGQASASAPGLYRTAGRRSTASRQANVIATNLW